MTRTRHSGVKRCLVPPSGHPRHDARDAPLTTSSRHRGRDCPPTTLASSMGLFRRLAGEYEQVAFCHDAGSGLRAVIAIHSTVLGPSLGGTRFFPYPSEEAAVEDVLRLARGMTYKSAAAGLDLGGGKAVVIGDP